MADPVKSMQMLCRECLSTQPGPAGRCNHCRSPRVIRHPELFDLGIAHIDCDAFYAAVEKRDNPELRDKPLIIGGGHRGVVSTACYIARTNGIRSAMPMFKALKLCPDAIVLRPDMAKYTQVSRQIRDLMESITPALQPISIDEAFLDLTGTERLHGGPPAQTLARLVKKIETDVGVTASVGLSHNKFLAKVASDLNKPRGFSVIGSAETLDFLAGQPVSVIWGVGKSLEKRLIGDGIRTIAHLRDHSETDLMKRYGVVGQRLYRLARGEDNRQVHRDGDAKSVSSETTLSTDLYQYGDLEPLLWRQCEKVSKALKKKGVAGWTAVLKLKLSNHRIITRSHRMDQPTAMAHVLFEHGRHLLARETREGKAYRLIGIGVSDLTALDTADSPDLVGLDRNKRGLAETAVDRLRARFGDDAVASGRGWQSAHNPRDKRSK